MRTNFHFQLRTYRETSLHGTQALVLVEVLRHEVVPSVIVALMFVLKNRKRCQRRKKYTFPSCGTHFRTQINLGLFCQSGNNDSVTAGKLMSWTLGLSKFELTKILFPPDHISVSGEMRWLVISFRIFGRKAQKNFSACHEKKILPVSRKKILRVSQKI